MNRSNGGVVMPRDDELASRPYITKEDLKGKPLIVSEQALINGELGEWVEDKRQVCATYNLFLCRLHGFERYGLRADDRGNLWCP